MEISFLDAPQPLMELVIPSGNKRNFRINSMKIDENCPVLYLPELSLSEPLTLRWKPVGARSFTKVMSAQERQMLKKRVNSKRIERVLKGQRFCAFRRLQQQLQKMNTAGARVIRQPSVMKLNPVLLVIDAFDYFPSPGCELRYLKNSQSTTLALGAKGKNFVKFFPQQSFSGVRQSLMHAFCRILVHRFIGGKIQKVVPSTQLHYMVFVMKVLHEMQIKKSKSPKAIKNFGAVEELVLPLPLEFVTKGMTRSPSNVSECSVVIEDIDEDEWAMEEEMQGVLALEDLAFDEEIVDDDIDWEVLEEDE